MRSCFKLSSFPWVFLKEDDEEDLRIMKFDFEGVLLNEDKVELNIGFFPERVWNERPVTLKFICESPSI